jgi:uncharacterized double-CXXCG motif protein
MRIFLALPDDNQWGRTYHYQIAGWYPWGLPGVRCPRCTTWSTSGLQLPSVDLRRFPHSAQYEDRWPVELEQFQALRDALAGMTPPGVQLLPGAEFGPICGNVTGRLANLNWINSWTLLVEDQALIQLRNSELRGLRPFDTQLVHVDQGQPKLFDLEILPRAAVAGIDASNSCPLCGRISVNAPERLVLKRTSIPEEEDLFRGVGLHTYVFVTERFVDIVRQRDLTGSTFEPVAVE